MTERAWANRRGIKILAGIAAVVAAAVAVAVAVIVRPPSLNTQNRAVAIADPALIARGKYVADLGDCVACHTETGGAPMAGGRALTTPFGTVYSTNITPDPDHGIGAYSYAQFDRAMRRGVNAGGDYLYPAMPYPSYAKMTDEDMRALYAFLMKGQPGVAKADKPAEMGFPFGMRFGLAFWDAAFLDKSGFVADPNHDATWNRGAYLVQSLGHCGACHTPRGIGFEEKAMSDAGANGRLFLAGERVENWNAINLRHLWPVGDTVDLLKTGQNRFATASGGMTEVIHNSTQNFNDADLVALATYLWSLPSDQPPVPVPAPAPGAVPKALFTTRGGLGYLQFCADCHRLNGEGVPGVFPPLAGNPTVAANDPATLVHIALTGWSSTQTETHQRVFEMPGFARLSDGEVAEILSFVRQSWSSRTSAIGAAEVARQRAEIDPKTTDQSKFDTPRLANMLSAPNADQLVRGMRLNVETRALLPDHAGNELNCTSCHLNGGTVADGSPYVGVSAFFPSYAARSGKVISLQERINGCFKRSMNGTPLAPGSADMTAMVAYFDWMKGSTKPEDRVEGRGVARMDMTMKPNVENGRRIYQDQCAVCHGKQGEGVTAADGRLVYPPLWGDQSFNVGAGMARTYTAAGFVKRNMPIGFRNQFPIGQGGLSDQDAIDVAEYFSHMPRPDFPEKVNDWPKDPKPGDSRY